MKRFYLSQDGRPCIWPIPADCLWTDTRFETNGVVKVSGSGDFSTEAQLLAAALADSGVLESVLSEGIEGIKLMQCSDPVLGSEGYRLEAGEDGICIQAATSHGIFNGCQTLIQMVRNSFDSSVFGVRIEDKPMKAFRGVKIPFPKREDLPWFLRFVELVSRYKINKLILDIGDAQDFVSRFKYGNHWDTDIMAASGSISARHIDVLPCVCSSEADGARNAFEEIIALFNVKTMSVDVGGVAAESNGKTAAEALADKICDIHDWLAVRGVGMAILSEQLYPSTGSRKLVYNEATRRNDVIPSTVEAIDLIPKDILVLDTNHGGIVEDTASQAYFADHGFNSVFGCCYGPLKNWDSRISCCSVQGAYVTIDNACSTAPGSGGNVLAAIMRVSCLLWWAWYRADNTARGWLLPLNLEREIAQLYPMERDWLEGASYPSAGNPGYEAINIRMHYNSPLQHSYWRVDDHFMMFLQDAMSLPNAIPFSLFQGVLDFRFQNAFVMAGGSWNDGIFGIRIGRKAHSLAFLHAYIIGKQQFIAGKDAALLGKTVGRYEIRYADGSMECEDIIYGRDIYFWKNYHGTNCGAYAANPVLMGMSEEGLHYTIYAREWINRKPDLEIVSLDVVPSGAMDGRVALFGITAVK